MKLNSIRNLHQLVSRIKVSRVEFSRPETRGASADSYRYWKSANDQHCQRAEYKKVDQVPEIEKKEKKRGLLNTCAVKYACLCNY